MAQAELVRQVIAAAQLKTQVAEREAKLNSTKTETEKKTTGADGRTGEEEVARDGEGP